MSTFWQQEFHCCCKWMSVPHIIFSLLIICCHQSTRRINSRDITCSFLSFGGAGGLIIMSPLSFSIYYWTHINVLTGAAQHKARHHQCLTIMWHLQRNICRQKEDGATNLFWLRDFWWDAERSFSRCWLHHIFISSLTSFLFFMSLMPAESRPGCYLIERKKKNVPLPVHGLVFITTAQMAVMHKAAFVCLASLSRIKDLCSCFCWCWRHRVTLPLLTLAALASWLALASLASCARVAAIRLSCASSCTRRYQGALPSIP